MTNNDLTPAAVDQHQHKELPPEIVILPYRKGHIYDPYDKIPAFGVEAQDSHGVTWTVRENHDGVYKCRPNSR